MITQIRNAVHTSLYSGASNFEESTSDPVVLSLPRERAEEVEKVSRLWAESAAKRGFDLLVAATGMIALLPIFGVVAICVKLTSRGPIFFRQERIGKGHVPFTIYKYRTMHVLAEEVGPSVTRAHDDRMTRMGSLLRRFKLDELPQLFNVVRGDMSLVGPRPKLEKHERMQMICRPGITGAATLVFAQEQILLSQVPEESFEHFTIHVLNSIKAELDTDYAKNSTFRTDLKMLTATLTGSRSRKAITDLSELLETYGSALQSQSKQQIFLD